MDLPLWVPWVLALALAWPVALRKRSPAPPTRAGLAMMLVPALAMTLYAAWLTLDQRSVSQDELDAAASAAAVTVRGGYGP